MGGSSKILMELCTGISILRGLERPFEKVLVGRVNLNGILETLAEGAMDSLLPLLTLRQAFYLGINILVWQQSVNKSIFLNPLFSCPDCVWDSSIPTPVTHWLQTRTFYFLTYLLITVSHWPITCLKCQNYESILLVFVGPMQVWLTFWDDQNLL